MEASLRRGMAILVGLAVGILAMSARAQSGLCDGLSTAVGNKVVIGAITGSDAARWPLLKRAIDAAINMEFQHARTRLKDRAGVLFCRDRRVENEAGYDLRMLGALNDKNVLIEVGAALIDGQAVVSYAVVPVRFYEYFQAHNIEAKGFHQALYGQRGQPLTERDLAALFGNRAEMKVFIALALALRHEKLATSEPAADLRSKARDVARGFYCDAIGAIPENAAHDGLGLLPGDWQAVAAYARGAAVRLMGEAIADPADRSGMGIVAAERARRRGAEPAEALFDCRQPQAVASTGGRGG